MDVTMTIDTVHPYLSETPLVTFFMTGKTGCGHHVSALRSREIGHFAVGGTVTAFSLIPGEKSVGGSPLGSPALTQTMMDFCVRHDIYPTVEEFSMSQVNEAIQHLEEGKARYRIVLRAD